MSTKKYGWFFLFLIILNFFEPMIKRAHRSLMYFLTDYSQPVIESLYFYISDVLIILFFLFFLLKSKVNLLGDNSTKRFLIFLFSVCLSSFFSPFSFTPYHCMHLWLWLSAFCLFVVSKECLRLVNKEGFFRTFFFFMIVLGSFEAVLGICQFFQGGPIGLRFLGEPKSIIAGFWMSPFCHTVIDWFFSQDPGYVFRAHGTFPHPNVLGGMLAYTLICSSVSYQIFPKRRKLILLSIFVQIAALFLSFSRSALFCFVIVYSFWCFIYWNKATKKLLFRMLFFFSVCFLLFYPQIMQRGGIVNYNSLSKNSDQGRIASVQVAEKIIREHPVFGVGMGNFMKVAKKLKSIIVHNVYLLFASEFGLIGLLSFLGFIAPELLQGWIMRRDLFIGSIWIGVCLFLLIGFLDFYPLSFHQSRFLFFLSLSYLPGKFDQREYDLVEI